MSQREEENTGHSETFALESEEPGMRGYETSLDVLAARLGISLRTLHAWRARGDAPPRKANGTYNVAEWHEWALVRGFLDGGDAENACEIAGTNDRENAALLREAVLREKRAKAERAELELAIRRGEVCELAAVEKTWNTAAATLFERAVKLIAGLYTAHAGKSPVDAIESAERDVNALFENISGTPKSAN